ncbi:MAG: MmgE/PrpD family protein [Firmicutes bacterium]|nr:MmgE/PrpD family protein [Alicyclobacillaceae bacterium]MCL6497157.1 MmgE/PrpD family protein [Bacillota bacterium]
MTLLETLAAFAVTAPSEAVPAAVRDHAHRAFANWLAVAYHAAHLPVAGPFLAVARRAGAGPVPVVGGPAAPAAVAALVNGALGHLDDFDDTHLGTVTHPTTPVIAATWAALPPGAEWAEWLDAIAVGTEVGIRVAECLSPSHYDRGWHITASTGGIGAAAGVARLWGLAPSAATAALALAALQPVGLRAAFGTMGKPYQVGRAAEIGWSAAEAAAVGVTAPPDALEHRRGLRIAGDDFHPEAITAELGQRWRFLEDTFKPYPSGIVTHPAIDAALALHAEIDPHAIRRVTAEVHPLVVELTGLRHPTHGLAVKFSATALIALALVRGRVAPEDFDQPLDPWTAAVERRVELVPTPALARDSATVTVECESGAPRRHHVAHARGSLARPLTWSDLSEKWRKTWPRGQSGAEDGWQRVKTLSVPPDPFRQLWGQGEVSRAG